MSELSKDTLDLAAELSSEKPNKELVNFLAQQPEADVLAALKEAKLKPDDLLKKPQLRSLGLQHYLPQQAILKKPAGMNRKV